MLYSVVKDHVITPTDLNHDLDTIKKWAYQCKMEFNPYPTKQAKEVLFSCKQRFPVHPDLVFNGTAVTKVDEHKHLGLILQSTLSTFLPLKTLKNSCTFPS